MDIPERLTALRARMAKAGVTLYLVPTSDFHGSEYVGEYFKCREYLSGFTGSAGTLLVEETQAWLWTDGRYFLQAQRQLEGSGITLMRMGEEGVPTLPEKLAELCGPGAVLGFDGRTLSARFVNSLRRKLPGLALRPGLDLAGEVWPGRPALSQQPVWELPAEAAGRTRAQKLADIRAGMRAEGAGLLLLTCLDEIAWLFNLRGDDVACCPVFLAYALVEEDHARLFAAREAFSQELAASLKADGVELCPYGDIFAALRALPGGSALWLDSATANYSLFCSLPAGTHVTDKPSPAVLAKSVKNDAEIQGEKTAHLYDGIALTKFIYRLKTGGAEGLTELSAADILEELRRHQPGYLGPSFETISAYGPHGAVVHYAPTPETDLPLQARGFLLVDSGGQYRTGTTDVTRTIALGPLTGQERQLYTAVLRGHLALAAARFRQGCTGRNLDYLARAPLWEKGLDYNHGTGHGVGFLLNVHEGPNNIRWRPAQNPADDAVLLPGMITSDEPGIYLDGRFGVRLENLLLCTQAQRTEYGVFLSFEPLTLAPFDRQAILPGEMTREELALLNRYHQRVYETLAPHLSPEEARWLQAETLPL